MQGNFAKNLKLRNFSCKIRVDNFISKTWKICPTIRPSTVWRIVKTKKMRMKIKRMKMRLQMIKTTKRCQMSTKLIYLCVKDYGSPFWQIWRIWLLIRVLKYNLKRLKFCSKCFNKVSVSSMWNFGVKCSHRYSIQCSKTSNWQSRFLRGAKRTTRKEFSICNQSRQLYRVSMTSSFVIWQIC